MRKNRAELKKQMALKTIRRNLNENILVDSYIMSMVRRLKKSKLLRKLRERRNKTPRKTPSRRERKSMTPKRRMVRKIS